MRHPSMVMLSKHHCNRCDAEYIHDNFSKYLPHCPACRSFLNWREWREGPRDFQTVMLAGGRS